MPRSFSLHTVHRLTTLCCLLFIKFHVRVRSLFWRQNGAAALLSRPRNRSSFLLPRAPRAFVSKKHSKFLLVAFTRTSLHDIAARMILSWHSLVHRCRTNDSLTRGVTIDIFSKKASHEQQTADKTILRKKPFCIHRSDLTNSID